MLLQQKLHAHFGNIHNWLHDCRAEVIAVPESPYTVKTNHLYILRHPQIHFTEYFNNLIGDIVRHAEQPVKFQLSVKKMLS